MKRFTLVDSLHGNIVEGLPRRKLGENVIWEVFLNPLETEINTLFLAGSSNILLVPIRYGHDFLIGDTLEIEHENSTEPYTMTMKAGVCGPLYGCPHGYMVFLTTKPSPAEENPVSSLKTRIDLSGYPLTKIDEDNILMFNVTRENTPELYDRITRTEFDTCEVSFTHNDRIHLGTLTSWIGRENSSSIPKTSFIFLEVSHVRQQ